MQEPAGKLKRNPVRPALKAWLTVAVLWGTAFCLACRLATPVASRPAPGSPSAAARISGSLRAALGRYFYEKADVYFHRGVEHVRATAFDHTPFQRVGRVVSPQAHAHATGAGLKEIMPWLWLAMQADPHRVEVSLNAAFWLMRVRPDRPRLALEVLREARFHNPYDHRIHTELARMHLKLGRPEEALPALRSGLACWPSGLDPAGRDARYDLARMLMYRALLHEIAGRVPRAVADMERVLRLFPDRAALRRRIADLRAGREPSTLARHYLELALKAHDDAIELSRHACHREHGTGPEDPHQHEHGHEHRHEHEGDADTGEG